MPRFALKVSYDGGPYSGFQWQDDHPSVQGTLEGAMRTLEPDITRLVTAGRTDAGVHALGQVVHFDLQRDWDPYRLSEAMNAKLRPHPIAVLAAARVADDFSARFSAIRRRYLYRVLMRRAPLTYSRGTVWHVRRPLDVDAMAEAARHLLGRHDFTTFRAAGCQAQSPVKSIDRLDIERVDTIEGPEVHFHVEARSFLYNQVRSFVGTLERVGIGAWTPEDVKSALAATARHRCGPVAPPVGLYLAEVGYESDIFADGYRDI